MTIDERLEALTQTVELLAGMHKETERSIQSLTWQTQRFEEFTNLVLKNHEERLRKIEAAQQ